MPIKIPFATPEILNSSSEASSVIIHSVISNFVWYLSRQQQQQWDIHNNNKSKKLQTIKQ